MATLCPAPHPPCGDGKAPPCLGASAQELPPRWARAACSGFSGPCPSEVPAAWRTSSCLRCGWCPPLCLFSRMPQAWVASCLLCTTHQLVGTESQALETPGSAHCPKQGLSVGRADGSVSVRDRAGPLEGQGPGRVAAGDSHCSLRGFPGPKSFPPSAWVCSAPLPGDPSFRSPHAPLPFSSRLGASPEGTPSPSLQGTPALLVPLSGPSASR